MRTSESDTAPAVHCGFKLVGIGFAIGLPYDCLCFRNLIYFLFILNIAGKLLILWRGSEKKVP